ncbi:MlaD family protein [Nocardia sp. NPDC127526]|uniref:MlaD family protein n=1 Tax=Nocardia sp. NPDC127526 TaxID=3345393 RepID=UPI0036270A9B
MQELKRRIVARVRRLDGDRPVLDPAALGRRELRLGLAGAMFLALLLVAAGVIYVAPVGKSTYTAELSEAQSIKVGDQVRLAGIQVGSVTGLELRPDRVRMTFTVDSGTFVGDRTSLDIRLLTIIGGHYVALSPAGTAPLGSNVIPTDRVHLPYSLIRSMQDAATPLAQVDGDTVRQNFGALQESLDQQPDAIRRMGQALQSLVTVLDQQNTDVSRALTIADEYLAQINANKALLGTFVRKVGLLATVGLNKRAEILTVLDLTAQLLSRIAALEPAWRESLEPLAEQLAAAAPALRELADKLGTAVDSFAASADGLRRTITPEGGIPADGICVPVPGKGC